MFMRSAQKVDPRAGQRSLPNLAKFGKGQSMKKDKQINVRVPQKMYDDLTARAKTEYKGITEVVRELIAKWIKRK